MDKKESSDIYSSIIRNPSLANDFIHLKLRERDIYKHTLIEKFPFSISDYLYFGKITEKSTLALIYFQPADGKSIIFPIEEKQQEALA